MKVIKTASGKNRLKLSKSEWIGIGKRSGWIKESDFQKQVGEDFVGKRFANGIKEDLDLLEKSFPTWTQFHNFASHLELLSKYSMGSAVEDDPELKGDLMELASELRDLENKAEQIDGAVLNFLQINKQRFSTIISRVELMKDKPREIKLVR